LAQLPNLSRQFSSTQVLFRFAVRTTILVAFAVFGSIGFGQSFSALLWISILISAVLAAVRREPPLDTALNHWDEMLAYAALFSLVNSFNQAV
jgi:hypothetical protein